MAIKIIIRNKTGTQQNITDYLGMPTFEEIDLRTPEGVQRYKEILDVTPIVRAQIIVFAINPGNNHQNH